VTDSFDTPTEADAPDTASQPRATVEIQPGTRVGRYVVLSRLGAGGMGVVLAAYDPELDRKVALKVLLTRAAGRESREARRLVREAMAMARLNHPNVLTLHDVGEHEGLVFLSMELVDGKTLKQKLQSERLGWPAVLELFLAAGRGLAAAHARGIVHRDFKPDNVMVGDDGRVRVMDFGLARDTARDSSSTLGADEAPLVPQDLAKPADPGLTVAGKVAGTPGYIAPELHRGEPADLRSDQFAFCVALYEGLFGVRPFGGDNAFEVAAATMEGRVHPIPAGSDVPVWVRRIVLRGLSTEPGARHPSIDALLAALGQRGSRTRRRLWITVGLSACIAGSGVLAAGVMQQRAAVERCNEAGDRIRELWNPETRVQLGSEFLASTPEYAAMAWEKSAAWLDRYADEWRTARIEACVAAQIDEVRSPELDARATECFEERLITFESLLREIGRGGDRMAFAIVDATSSLPTVQACEDEAALQRRPPSDMADAAERVKIQRLLADAAGQDLADRDEEGRETVREALRRASEIGATSLEAQARLSMASLLYDAGEYAAAAEEAEQAFLIAGRQGDDDIAAESACMAAGIAGAELRRVDEGLRWARLAEMAIGRLGEADTPRAASCLVEIGRAQVAAADYDEAQASFERARTIIEREIDPEHPRLASVTMHLGNVAFDRGDNGESERLQAQALELSERAFGPDHPLVAGTLNNIANTLGARGELDRAQKLYERALAIRLAAQGEEHPSFAETLMNLAIVHYQKGDYGKALEVGARAIELLERKGGPDHPDVAEALNNMVNFAASSGDFDAAERHQARALAIRERMLPPDHPDIAASLTQLGLLAAARPDSDAIALGRARSALERALRIWETKFGPDHPDSAYALHGLGQVLARQGDREAAVESLERALRLRDKMPGDFASRAETRFALARVLRQLHRDPVRARTLATEALELYREGGEMFAADVADIEAWLAN